jgi:hypothetical protein
MLNKHREKVAFPKLEIGSDCIISVVYISCDDRR